MRLTCPSCESSYQLADGALGATGRKVRCTRCGTVWHARPGADLDTEEDDPVARAAARFPEPSEDEWKAALAEDAPVGRPAEAGADDDRAATAAEGAGPADAAADGDAAVGGAVVPFRPREETAGAAPASDAAAAPAGPTIEAENPSFAEKRRERRKAGPAPKAKPKKRRGSAGGESNSTVVGVAAALVFFLSVGALFGREQVVRLFPDFAGLYAAVGLPVNLRGLAFGDVQTSRELDGATPVLVVEGTITNVTTGVRPVPSLRFSLLSALDREVYAWTMEAPKDRIGAGETIRFKSRLPAPPDAAVDAQVRFVDQRGP